MPGDTTLERPLPHNLEAERSILGAILLDNHALNAAIEKVRSDDFFLPQHRQIFERMVQLGEKQQAIDIVTLMEDLRGAANWKRRAGLPIFRNWRTGCRASPTWSTTRGSSKKNPCCAT